MKKIWRNFVSLGLTLLALSCSDSGHVDEVSELNAVTQDSYIKVLRMPLPTQFFGGIEEGFPSSVPLVTSTLDGSEDQEQRGFWVLCHNPAEEEAVLRAMGIDYQRYKNLKKDLIKSPDLFPPHKNRKERDAKQKDYCEESSANFNNTLCLIYKLLPDLNSPIICPSSLDKVFNYDTEESYQLKIYNNATKSFAEFDSLAETSVHPPVDLGCRELRDSLIKPGNSYISVMKIKDTEDKAKAVSLNCTNGTAFSPESFESLCEAARGGKSEADLFLLNALTHKLKISGSTSCTDLPEALAKAIADEGKFKLDLAGASLTSLKLLRYLSKLVDLKDLDLSNNPALGTNDSDVQGELDNIKGFVNLTSLNVNGTKISNALGIAKQQFLKWDETKINWSEISPNACSTTSVSPVVRDACEKLQKPITITRKDNEKNDPIYVATGKDGPITLQAQHDLAGMLTQFSYSVTSATCADAKLEGTMIKLGSKPAGSCQVVVSASGGRLKTGSITLQFEPLDTCSGNNVGTEWDELQADKTLRWTCDRIGNKVTPRLVGGKCKASTHDFNMNKISCEVKRCENGQEIGKNWPVDTTDKRGVYRNVCVLKGASAVQEYVPNSGICTASEYSFDEKNLSCQLKRCPGGQKIGDNWLVETTQKDGSYRLECALQNGSPSERLVANSGACNNKEQYEFDTSKRQCVAVRCTSPDGKRGDTNTRLGANPGVNDVYVCTPPAWVYESSRCTDAGETYNPITKKCETKLPDLSDLCERNPAFCSGGGGRPINLCSVDPSACSPSELCVNWPSRCEFNPPPSTDFCNLGWVTCLPPDLGEPIPIPRPGRTDPPRPFTGESPIIRDIGNPSNGEIYFP